MSATTEYPYLRQSLVSRVQSIPGTIKLNACSFESAPTTAYVKFNGATSWLKGLFESGIFSINDGMLEFRVMLDYANQSGELVTIGTAAGTKFLTARLTNGVLDVVIQNTVSNISIIPINFRLHPNRWYYISVLWEMGDPVAANNSFDVCIDGWPVATASDALKAELVNYAMFVDFDILSAAQQFRGGLQRIRVWQGRISTADVLQNLNEIVVWQDASVMAYFSLDDPTIGFDNQMSIINDGVLRYYDDTYLADAEWEEDVPVWLGASVLIAEATVTMSEPTGLSWPFLLHLFEDITEFFLCISYETDTGFTVRYLLNPGAAVDELFLATPYTGQDLPETFNFEMWSIKDKLLTELEEMQVRTTLRRFVTRNDALVSTTYEQLAEASFSIPAGAAFPWSFPLVFA